MSDQRIYDGTGASAFSGGNYISVDDNEKKGAAREVFFRFADERMDANGKPFTAVTGFFDGLSIERKPEKGKLPARWEYQIGISMLDEGAPKTFRLQISSHWKSPAVGQVMNALAGIIAAERYPQNVKITVSVYAKKSKTDEMVTNMSVRIGGGFAPTKFPWDEENKCHVGVPRDMSELEVFWYGEAVQIATKFPLSGSTPPTITDAPVTAGVIPPPVNTGTAVEPSPEENLRKFKTWLNGKLNEVVDPLLAVTQLQTIFKSAHQKRPDNKTMLDFAGYSLGVLFSDLMARYQDVTGDVNGTIDPKSGMITPGKPADDGDLPF